LRQKHQAEIPKPDFRTSSPVQQPRTVVFPQIPNSNPSYPSQVNTNLSNISGTWIGKYVCGQGVTGLTLKISQNGIETQAEFIFYPVIENPTVPSGSAIYKGYFDSNSGQMTMFGSYWIKQPNANWTMAGFTGSFDQLRQTFTGRIQSSNCGGIELSRQATVTQSNLQSAPIGKTYVPPSFISQSLQNVTFNDVEVSFNSNLLDETIQKGRKFLESDPDNSVAHSYVGVSLLTKNDIDGAVYHLERAITQGSSIEFPIKRLRELIGQSYNDVKIIISKDNFVILHGNTIFRVAYSDLTEATLLNYKNQCAIVQLKGMTDETYTNSSKSKRHKKQFDLFPLSSTLTQVKQGYVVINEATCNDDGVIMAGIVKLINNLALRGL
jgi:hypothetical protein